MKINKECFTYKEAMKYVEQFEYYDENNKIDNISIEIQEQIYHYIEPNDVVLELGARYGTVYVVNSLLNNKKPGCGRI